MLIQVTQYLRPDGRRKVLQFTIPDEYQQQYDLICKCGCEITCEQLMSGKAVQYIGNEHGDFITKLTGAGDREAAGAALFKMIQEFNKDRFEKWNSQFKEKQNEN